MKGRIGLLVAIIGVFSALWLWVGDRNEEGEKRGNTLLTKDPSSTVTQEKANVVILADAPFMQEFGNAETSEERELELIQLAFQDYLSFVKKGWRRPLGDNIDFTALLSGGNPYRIAPIAPAHERVNVRGELTDRNGIPFFIHPLSEELIEVRAAGPDGEFGTLDDLLSVTVRGHEVRERALGEVDSQ